MLRNLSNCFKPTSYTLNWHNNGKKENNKKHLKMNLLFFQWGDFPLIGHVSCLRGVYKEIKISLGLTNGDSEQWNMILSWTPPILGFIPLLGGDLPYLLLKCSPQKMGDWLISHTYWWITHIDKWAMKKEATGCLGYLLGMKCHYQGIYIYI